MCSPPLREAGKPSLPLTLLLLLFSYPPLREVGIAYLPERIPLTKVLGSTSSGSPLPRSYGGNFSEKPPETIPVWGQDGMDGGSEEGSWEGQEMAGVEQSLTAMQQSITQLTQAIGQTLTPQGKGQGRGPAKGQGERQCKAPRGTQS